MRLKLEWLETYFIPKQQRNVCIAETTIKTFNSKIKCISNKTYINNNQDSRFYVLYCSQLNNLASYLMSIPITVWLIF